MSARVAELENQIARLTGIPDGGGTAVAGEASAADNGEAVAKPRTRRDLLKLAGAAAAGAAGVVAMRPVAASAADGGAFILGASNTTTLTTSLLGGNTSSPAFRVGAIGGVTSMEANAFSASGTALGVNGYNGANALYAQAPGGVAVVGLSDTNTAVRANSASGLSVEALGTGRILQTPNANTPNGGGAPTYAPVGPEQVRDSNGMLWLSGPGSYPHGWAPAQPGGAGNAIFTAVSNSQYTLTGNDGATWQEIDPALALVISPNFAAYAVIYANADLWTATAGFNQDLGVFIQINQGTDTLHSWKESGGFAGTYSPNAVFIHAVAGNFFKGTTYTVRLKWKSNKAGNATIAAGAGPYPAISTSFSPIRLSVQLIAV